MLMNAHWEFMSVIKSVRTLRALITAVATKDSYSRLICDLVKVCALIILSSGRLSDKIPSEVMWGVCVLINNYTFYREWILRRCNFRFLAFK